MKELEFLPCQLIEVRQLNTIELGNKLQGKSLASDYTHLTRRLPIFLKLTALVLPDVALNISHELKFQK